MDEKKTPKAKIPFYDAQLKMWHALETKKQIDALLQRWFASDAIKLMQTPTPNLISHPDELYTVITAIANKLPPIFPLLIGDCIHHISTAFDHIISDVAHSYGADNTRTALPIRKWYDDVNLALESRIYDKIPTRVKGIILENVKPFWDGNFNIWATRKLDNIEKHRMITPTLHFSQIEVSFRGGGGEIVDHFTIGLSGSGQMSFPVVPAPISNFKVHDISGIILLNEPSIFEKPAPFNTFVLYAAMGANGMMDDLSKEIYGISANQTW